MKSRHSLLMLLAAVAIISLLVASCAPIAEQLPELGPPDQGEGTPEEPAPTEPPAEPEATEPPPEPEPTQAPPEPEPTTPPAGPQPTTAPPAGPQPEEPPVEGRPSWDLGQLLFWGIVLVVPVGIVIGVIVLLVGRRGEEEAPPEVPLVPITTVAQDIKEGRVGKILVSGEDLTITRIDGLVMASHKEPTADLVQLMTNLGVTPEMMSSIVIEVETPEPPTG